MEVLAKRLKWLREKERYSQKDIADKIKMSPSGYQKIERAERDPKLDVLVMLCNIFEVSADFLLGRENFTEESDEIAAIVNSKIEEIKMYNHELSEMTLEISELREQMIFSAQEKGFAHEETTNISDKLNQKLKEYGMVKKMIERSEKVRNEKLLEYIIELLEIPEVNLHDDYIINTFAPYGIAAQMTIFDEFELILACEKIEDSLGSVKTCKTEEEVDFFTEDILRKLNGE